VTVTTPSSSETPPPIVVGVDGSDASIDALTWAAHQAAATGEAVEALVTWSVPQSFGYPVPWPEGVDFAKDAQTELEGAIGKVAAAVPGFSCAAFVVEGHPALELVERSRTAHLLVVGSRGRGEIVGMLLGSVSTYVGSHASCPVVIVRGAS
jgi:nucleotide-binding universal stress UspA family protein